MSDLRALRRPAVVLPGLLLLAATQYAWVEATNFGGHDEWLLLDLAHRGVVSFPPARRALGLLWGLPAARIAPYWLEAYLVQHALYLGLTAWLLVGLVRRLAPKWPLLALLAGVFSLTWAPLDSLRLNAVQVPAYTGATFAAYAAVALFVEAWLTGRRSLLVVAAVGACLAALTTESTLPLLVAAPVAAACTPRPWPRRLRAWAAAWIALVTLLTASVLVPFLPASGAGTYQTSGLKLDLHPFGIGARLAEQFGFHLLPLVTSPPHEWLRGEAALAVAVFLVLAALVVGPEAGQGSGQAARVAALGGLLAALGYAAFVLSPSIRTPARTQFLSTPGIALLLAGLLAALADHAARRSRVLLLAGGALVVAMGTGRTLALQGDWDRRTAWPVQRQTLAGLVRDVPDVVPETLIVLLDDTGAWPASFTFRHAVTFLYEGRGVGMVAGGDPYLYPCRFLAAGVVCEPWPMIRKAWNERVSTHPYSHLVLVRHVGSRVERVPAWPADVRLPPFPAEADYDPGSRIRPLATAVAARALLGEETRARVP